MPAKKHKPEEIIGKLREVEIVLGQDGTIAEACRHCDGGAFRSRGLPCHSYLA